MSQLFMTLYIVERRTASDTNIHSFYFYFYFIFHYCVLINIGTATCICARQLLMKKIWWRWILQFVALLTTDHRRL